MVRLITLVVTSLLGLIHGISAPLAAERPTTIQEVFLRAKPAVVLVIAEVNAEVTLDCGSGVQTVTPPIFRETGTGWFVDGRGWIITNGHVIQPAYSPPRWLINQQAQRAVSTACLPKALAQKGVNPGERPEMEDAIKRKVLDAVLPTTKVKLTPQVTVLVSNGAKLKAEVVKYSPPVSAEPGAMSGRDLALLKVPGEVFPVLPLVDSRNVQIGDPLHILGFPGVVLSHELLNKSASMEASVTNGAVSGLKEDVSNQPVIQTDAPAAWGNSGGPAVTQRGQVVGVLTFVSLAPGAEGSIVQGFNFVIPADAVREFVKGTPVQLSGTSKFNEAWYAALRGFFTEDYSGAVRDMERADQLVPNLPDLKRQLAEAREFVKNPPPRPFPWFWVAIGVTLLSGAGWGVQFLRRWQKNRYRVSPSEVIKLLEGGKQPQILDVRTSAAYDTLPLKIPGSTRLAPEELASGVSGLELDLQRPVVAYCTSPDEQTSSKVAKALRKLGFKTVLVLKGGLGAWTNAGLPIESRSDVSAVGLELYKALAGGNA
ncbi:MAG TPA: trypsin-like peptidase domain-containing protein [Methylomirabilota bacterium]|jgi:S1-C subfamily serine protease/rhodanese-related sulfurtransferase|nr:trypsin-like peptidase domain-containing protein [Methylomirabilota bacterium]